MITFTIGSFLGIFQIIIQAIAAYYSYRIFSFNRINRGWLALTFALVLMTFRRITALLIEFSLLPKFGGLLDFTDKFLLPTFISVFLLVGLWTMLKNFENFEVVEKQVKKIIKRGKNEK